MNFLQVFLLSFIEGVTEFLPVSSTGHLILVSHFLSLPSSIFLTSFEVVIQLGAILAIFFIYRHRFFSFSLWSKVILSFLPIGLIGFLFADFIESLFSPHIVAFTFIVGGLGIICTEYLYRRRSSYSLTVSSSKAFFIGLFQLLALIPGMSRSASTIAGGMLLGLSRSLAVEFSFFAALPVMLASSGYSFLKHFSLFTSQDLIYLLTGFFLSFLFAYLVAKLLIVFVKNHTLLPFAYYRILVGLLILWILS